MTKFNEAFPATAAQIADADTPVKTLLELYNSAAAVLPAFARVERFADRAAAVRRTTNIFNTLAENEDAHRKWAAKQLIAEQKAEDAKAFDEAPVMAENVGAPVVAQVAMTLEKGRKARQQEAAKMAILEADGGKVSTPEPAGKRELWRRAKHEKAARIAYRPRPGTVQAALYSLLTQPGGVLMEDFCAAVKRLKTKDSTLFTPPAVWGALRYLFVTSRGYGLAFDGQRLQLLVPDDERDSPKNNTKAA